MNTRLERGRDKSSKDKTSNDKSCEQSSPTSRRRAQNAVFTAPNDFPRQYLLAKPAAQEYFPFYPDVPVYKVVDKIFAIAFVKAERWYLNLKATPENVEILRSLFTDITPGYHMNKRHWITVALTGEIPEGQIHQLIDESYNLVVGKFDRKRRLQLIGAYNG